MQPLLNTSLIPVGIGGAIGGHLLLVHYVNQRREAGVELVQAVRESAVARFRPIFLTSATTFLGLAPLISARSMQELPSPVLPSQ